MVNRLIDCGALHTLIVVKHPPVGTNSSRTNWSRVREEDKWELEQEEEEEEGEEIEEHHRGMYYTEERRKENPKRMIDVTELKGRMRKRLNDKATMPIDQFVEPVNL